MTPRSDTDLRYVLQLAQDALAACDAILGAVDEEDDADVARLTREAIREYAGKRLEAAGILPAAEVTAHG